MSLDTEIACVLRELSLRKKVYPNLVVRNRMTQAQADHELATMEAVYRRLAALAALQEQPSLFDMRSRQSAPGGMERSLCHEP